MKKGLLGIIMLLGSFMLLAQYQNPHVSSYVITEAIKSKTDTLEMDSTTRFNADLLVTGTSKLNTITGTWNGDAIGDSYLTKSGNWTGTFDGQEGIYYLDRTNHTGTQLMSTISDVTATSTELNYVDGVTSNIQTQLDNKQPVDDNLTELSSMGSTVGFYFQDAADAPNVRYFKGTTGISGLTTGSDGGGAYVGINLTSNLEALAGIASTADGLPYFTGSGTMSVSAFTSAGRAILDDASASAQRTTLGGTTVGQNLFTLPNPSAIRFLRINAGNTVTAQTAANFRTDLGLGALATQNASAIDVTGGAINGTTIGATTPNTGAFTGITTDPDGTGNHITLKRLGTTIGNIYASSGSFELRPQAGVTLSLGTSGVDANMKFFTSIGETIFVDGGTGLVSFRDDVEFEGTVSAPNLSLTSLATETVSSGTKVVVIDGSDDVKTVTAQSIADLALAGEGIYKTVKRRLSAAEVGALNTTPIEILPAPGVGKVYVVSKIIYFLDYVSAWTNETVRVQYTTPSIHAFGNSAITNILDDTSDQMSIRTMTTNENNNVTNGNIEVTTVSADPTGGTSELVISIVYTLLDID